MGLCRTCGVNEPQINKLQCKTCVDKSIERNKIMRAARKSAGMCIKCNKNAIWHTSKWSCRACLDVVKERGLKLKLEVFEAYGGCKCSCIGCNVTHQMFLGMDHINNDGAKHRKEVGSGVQFYTWLRKNSFPPGFRVLCHNCNLGKQINGGVCPHEDVS